MLFLTLFFIFTYGYLLAKGKLFYETVIENTKFNIDKAKDPQLKPSTDLGGRVIGATLYMLMLAVFLVIYFVKAISVDPYLYPTLTMIGLTFINFFVQSLLSKKEDLTDEKQARKKLVKTEQRYTVKTTLANLVRLTYFVYMFLVLVELIK
jgi:hypothetical protein